MGRRYKDPVPVRCRRAGASPGVSASADRGRTDRPPAHAPRGRRIHQAWPGPRCGARQVRCGHCRSDAPAQFRMGGGAADRVRLQRRRTRDLAHSSGHRCDDVVRKRSRRRTASHVGGRMVRLRQPAGVPVHSRSLVFPAVHLGAFSLAGVEDRSATRADPSRLRRRTRLSRQHQPGVCPAAGRAGRAARRCHGKQDLLCRREAGRFQDGSRRAAGRDAVFRPRAAAGVRPA